MLAPGTRVGPYEVTGQIGVGGMGEVYRATDTNLGRQVAIKVLPDAVAMDTERLARFDREARMLAALNHPNIAGIYGVERSGPTTALVMELVEGPTLADRIIEGPVPIAEAIAIARQVAEGLEAAHEQGIVHRDLKPANIKVRPARMLGGDGARMLGSFTPDGKRLAYVRRGSLKGRPLTFKIVTTTVTEENGQLKSGTPEPFSPPQFNETTPEFSPDGKWIAFVTDRSGRDEVAVRAFPVAPSGSTPEAVLSNNGGSHPRWSPNGRELLYVEGERIMTVTYKVNADTFVPDKPRVLFEKAGRQWDLAPDGRVALIEPVESQSGAEPAAEHHVVFLEHFGDEVQRRVK